MKRILNYVQNRQWRVTYKYWQVVDNGIQHGCVGFVSTNDILLEQDAMPPEMFRNMAYMELILYSVYIMDPANMN